MITDIALLFGALLSLELVVWSWRGKSRAARWWLRFRDGEFMVLCVIPAMALGIIGGNFYEDINKFNLPVLSGIWAFVFVGGSVFCFVYGTVVTTIGIFWWPAQKAWGPRWYANMTWDERRQAAKTTLNVRLGQISATEGLTAPSWFGSPLSAWLGGNVVDPDTRGRPDIHSALGTVQGQLIIGTGGVWFAPAAASEAWATRAAVSFPWSELRHVRTVAARAGTDGVVQPGVLFRSWSRRLVLTTIHGELLFEIDGRGANQAAAAISTEWEKHRAD